MCSYHGVKLLGMNPDFVGGGMTRLEEGSLMSDVEDLRIEIVSAPEALTSPMRTQPDACLKRA
jgi:hypothetical protein